ncbi:predicted protein [Plenodomus lingam JN3]|uniref:Predicted protein n=1 Tax=Leptosphaeria maculans (strain JN3 / isolate v23.1.3 / race Av1-4-5-6-7-8) TaxID=985895 RepID=E4ZNY6_LEPMJ|nr:predicted protein [Plenodomus lingam JN3]CBX93355.1 predicted protein [Plenodomus lingam JN3]
MARLSYQQSIRFINSRLVELPISSSPRERHKDYPTPKNQECSSHSSNLVHVSASSTVYSSVEINWWCMCATLTVSRSMDTYSRPMSTHSPFDPASAAIEMLFWPLEILWGHH